MDTPLRELVVLAIDCQASGATPAHGDLLELGWSLCSAAQAPGPVRSHWLVPRTQRPVSRAVRELTGWQESCLGESIAEGDAWQAMCTEIEPVRVAAQSPAVIHYARFELGFLHDLHQRV